MRLLKHNKPVVELSHAHWQFLLWY